MPKMLELTNKRVLEINQGFTLLAGRALPSRITAQRVAIYWKRIKEAAESYDEAMKPLRRRELEALKLDENNLERDREMASIEAEVDAMNAAIVEVLKPRVRLIDSDLPISVKTKDGTGAMNVSGNAAIQGLLSPEFFDLKDPDADMPDEDDEEDEEEEVEVDVDEDG